jgi:hypothetical protein
VKGGEISNSLKLRKVTGEGLDLLPIHSLPGNSANCEPQPSFFISRQQYRSKAYALRWKLMWFSFLAINENDLGSTPRQNRLFAFYTSGNNMMKRTRRIYLGIKYFGK